jgi:hypothetical protein
MMSQGSTVSHCRGLTTVWARWLEPNGSLLLASGSAPGQIEFWVGQGLWQFTVMFLASATLRHQLRG